MNEFLIYLQLGFHHIADLKAYDHLLFVITLCAPYLVSEWKKILVLVTAFTIGHSLTLALAALDIFRLPSGLVEILIPITILLTSLHNVIAEKPADGIFAKAVSVNYLLALFFGLIHGMGFANYFNTLMGELGNVVAMLFPFNVGIELGQVMIVGLFFLFHWLLVRFFNIGQKSWNLYISGAGGGVAVVLILQQLL